MENNNLPANVRPEDLPIVITQAVSGIEEIDRKIQASETKAKTAQRSAKKAKEKSAGWSMFGGDKKEAIEALQTAAVDQANALSSSIDANKELFDNQKKMTQAITYLFGLGVVNMAANRTVVQQLEMKLREASQSELSEFARKEIESVILQLRAQEDIQKRIEGHDELLREHKDSLDNNASSVEALKTEIATFKQKCEQTLSSMKNAQTTIEQVRAKASNALDSLPSKLSDMERKLKDASAEQALKINTDFERLKEEQDALDEGLKTAQEKRLSELETSLKQQISTEMESSISSIKTQMESIEKSISGIKEQLDNKSFFDSTIFKILITVLVVIAIALHFIPLT